MVVPHQALHPSSPPTGANIPLHELPPGIHVEPLTFRSQDGALSRGLLYTPQGRRPRVGVQLMHPKNDQSLNYNIVPLVQAGYAVIGRGGRWVNNDSATIHEKLLLDVAEGVKLLRQRGCEAVLHLGNSGGGGLSCLYQAQAARPPGQRYTHTPGGEPFDLNAFELPALDGLLLVGAHPGEGRVLAKWLDPSVVDEADPCSVDAALDLYDPANGFAPPPQPSRYDAGFLARFRTAQAARLQRLDALARSRIAQAAAHDRAAAALAPGDAAAALALQRRAMAPNHLRIHRTQADPALADLSIEPDDRLVSAYTNHPRPDHVNWNTSVALHITPQAWLSTWSGLSSRAGVADRLAETTVPLLVVHYAGDVITRLSEARAMHDASAASDKSLVIVRHADHYGYRLAGGTWAGGRDPQGTDAVVAWLQQRFPA